MAELLYVSLMGFAKEVGLVPLFWRKLALKHRGSEDTGMWY